MTGNKRDRKVQLTRRFSRQGLRTKPEQPAPTPLLRLEITPRGRPSIWLCGPGLPPIPLDGIRLLVGRHSGCDMILPDASISRRHAVFKARGKVVVFEDQGSRNGSLVNGEKVTKPRVLHPGDTVAVGPYLFEVREAPPRKTSGRLPALTGSLEDMALREVVQGIELHRKTCTLKVQSEGASGFLTAREGVPCQAKWADLVNEAAVIEMLCLSAGTFALIGEAPDVPATIQSPLRTLLFRAMQRTDEGQDGLATQQF